MKKTYLCVAGLLLFLAAPVFGQQAARKNDPRVPETESDQILYGLKKQGTPVWYIMAKDKGDGFQKKAKRDFEF